MGREVKRVDLNNPPAIGVTWPGYLNPFYEHCKPCEPCDGSGYSTEARLYAAQWYGHAPFDPVEYGAKPLTIDDPDFKESVRRKVEWSVELAKRRGEREWFTDNGRLSLDYAVQLEVVRMFDLLKGQWAHHLIQADVDALIDGNRLCELTSVWTDGEGWRKREGVVVTADQVNIWSLSGIGHDAINRMLCIDARCKRNNEPIVCDVCKGSGTWWPSEELKAQYEAWEQTDPPIGEGYQIWETVSEGSPVSPAFADPRELAAWMVKNDTSVTSGNDFDTWMKFIDAGWAPSLVAVAGEVQNGVSFVGSRRHET